MKRRLISFFIAFIIVLSIVNNSTGSSMATQNDVLNYRTESETLEFTLSDGTVFYTNTISYPLFSGNTSAEKVINEKYQGLIEEYRNNSTNFDALYLSMEEEVSIRLHEDYCLPFYENVTAEVSYCNVDNDIISIVEYQTSYSPVSQSHPAMYISGYTYSITTGKLFSLEDILCCSTEELETIINCNNNDVVGYYSIESVLQSPFYLTEDGLIIRYWFGDYIAVRSLFIPYSEFDAFTFTKKDSIQPEDYTSIIQSIFDKYGDNATGYGFLFDANNDGIDELFIEYTDRDCVNLFGAVYTTQKNTAIPIHKESTLCFFAGGLSDEVGVITIDDTRYICVMGGQYSTDLSGGESAEHWTLYRIESDGFSLPETILFQCSFHDVDDDDSWDYYITKNQQEISKEEYDNLLSSVVHTRAMSISSTVDWVAPVDQHSEGEIMDLHTLLSYLNQNRTEEFSEHVSGLSNVYSEWINQHLAFAASDSFGQKIVSGYSNTMLSVFREALKDKSVRDYNLGKATSQILNLNFEIDDKEMYKLILMESLYNSSHIEMIQDDYIDGYDEALHEIATILVNIGNAIKDASEIEIMPSLSILYEIIANTHITSPEFNPAFSKFVDILDSNFRSPDFLEKLKQDLGFFLTNVAIDGLLETYDTLKDIVQFCASYKAYLSTSDHFVAVLELMKIRVDMLSVSNTSPIILDVHDFPELDTLEATWNWADFSCALQSIIDDYLACTSEGAQAIAEYAVERVKEANSSFVFRLETSLAVFTWDTIVSKIPVFQVSVYAKYALNIMILAEEILTNVDEKAYAVDMLKKLYVISVVLDGVVDICANELQSNNYYTAAVFDESIKMYKGIQELACDYAMVYIDMELSDAILELKAYDWSIDLFTNRNKLVDAVNRYKRYCLLLAEQKADIQSISCHDSALDLIHSMKDNIQLLSNSNIYIVACPVDVIIRDKAGYQIAYLSGIDNRIVDGYDSLFRLIKYSDDPESFIKIAIIPNEYSVELLGTGDGTMDLFIADCSNDTDEVETFFHIPINNGSVGQLTPKSNIVADHVLVVDNTSYTNMRAAEDDSTQSQRGVVWLVIFGALIVCISGVLIVVRVRKR